MQLLGIYIYGRNGKRRDVLLRPGNLNIISGASKTGKSALIDILEYCLGAGECRVPPGTIRDAAVWYGILLQLAEGQLFIARADPGEKRSSTEIYYELATMVDIPDLQGLSQNINTDGLIDLLTQKSGIGENQHEVEPGNTRLPLEANIKHALKFCIQRQDEIARRSQLFHSQDDPYISQALKDSLPYFLGVVNDERLHAQAELRRLTAVERALQREASEAVLPIESETPIARLLLAEAQDVGLVRAVPIESSDELIGVLRRSAAGDDADESLDEDASSGMRILRREREELTSQYRLQRERLALLTGFSSERDSYVAEVTDQMGRLGPATVFPQTHNVSHCPLCSSPVSDDIPSVAELQASLEELRSQISAIQETRPRIDSRINELSLGVERLRLKLRSNHQAIVRLTEQQDELMLQRPLHLRQSHVKGRISLYLESIDSAPDPVSELNERLRDLRTSIERLRQELAMTDVVQRLASALNIVGTDMTQLANELDFEFGIDRPLHQRGGYDPKRTRF